MTYKHRPLTKLEDSFNAGIIALDEYINNIGKDTTAVFACKARKNMRNTMHFWCPYCKQYHLHGSVNGLRQSHCTSRKSPLYGKQYIVYLEGGRCE